MNLKQLFSRVSADGPSGATAAEKIDYILEKKVRPADRETVERAVGAIIGSAVGDALGAGYEFMKPAPSVTIEMKGGERFGFLPGEVTDDTDQAWLLGVSLQEKTTEAVLSNFAQGLKDWLNGQPKDVGIQTAAILDAAEPRATVEELYMLSERYHKINGQSGGNGSLMRIAPLGAALKYSEQEVIKLAQVSSKLTHFDPDAGDVSAFWALAIRFAVERGGMPDFHNLVEKVWPAQEERERWRKILDNAGQSNPDIFTPNGYVVTALEACYSALSTLDCAASPEVFFKSGLERVIRIGNDTDTTAAILGGLLGAYCGYRAIPEEWVNKIFGQYFSDASELATLAIELSKK